MKNHTIPAGATHMEPSGGVVNYYQRGFNWPKAIHRALEKKKHRAIHLARTNPDYKIAHPNECRDNPENKILLCCHPEAEKRITEEHIKMIKLSVVPTVERPKRLNRSGN